jgi:hypothetical protein
MVAVVAGGTWVAADGGLRTAPAPGPATEAPTSPPAPSEDVEVDDPSTPPPITAQMRRDLFSGSENPAAYDRFGRLVIRRGWTVTRRIPNPMHYTPPSRSVGLEVRKGDEVIWTLVTHEASRFDDSSTGGSTYDPAYKSFATIEPWLAQMVELQGGVADGADVPPRVTMRSDGTLRAPAGATVVRQVPDPDVPGFAGPGDDTAAAEVVRGEQVWFVLARRAPGAEAELFPLEAEVLDRATLSEFLAYARAAYAGGEGLR